MEWHTHAAGGLLAGLGISSLAPQYFGGIPHGLAIAVASALVMDIDHPGSLIGRLLFFFPGVQRGPGGRIVPYNRDYHGRAGRRLPGGWILWHREQMHSFGFLFGWSVAVGIGAAFWGGPGEVLPAAISALAGGLSHLALDRFNRSGEYLFWPFRRGTRGHVGDWWPHLRPGGIGEAAIFIGLLFPLLQLMLPGYAGALLHSSAFTTFMDEARAMIGQDVIWTERLPFGDSARQACTIIGVTEARVRIDTAPIGAVERHIHIVPAKSLRRREV